MKVLFVTREILENKNLSAESICVFAAIKNIIYENKNEYYVTLNMITYYMLNREASRREQIAIKNGFQELIDNKYIVIKKTFGNNEYVCDISKLYHKHTHVNAYFSDVTDEELHAIMNMKDTKSNINKYKVFRYFACMVGSFNRSKTIPTEFRCKLGGLPLNKFSELIGITERTAAQYNNILEENKLLYVVRYNLFNHNCNDQLRERNNTYCRYSDRALADKYSAIILANYSSTDVVKKESNTKRGLSQKYNALRRGKVYSKEVIKEIYDYCVKWNSEQEENYNQEIEKGYKPKKPEYKDIKIFKKYFV